MEKKASSTYNNFQIIRHRGTPTKGQLPDGTWVYAQDKFWVPDMNGFIYCFRYDDHFLYEIPDKVKPLYPGPIFRCSCGSESIYLAPDGYMFGASPQGLMFACKYHVDHAVHATGGARWV